MIAKFRYDRESDAAYLRFSDAAVAESEEVSPGVVLDFDDAGRLVALEILGAAERLPADALVAAE